MNRVVIALQVFVHFYRNNATSNNLMVLSTVLNLAHAYNPNTWEAEEEDQNCEANLNYLERCCLQTQTKEKKPKN